MKPPSGGPITGPTSAGTVTQAIALTSALLSIERSSTSRPTGVIIAPPAPCRMRAMTSSVTEEDSAQPIEPTMKTATAIENTMRAPKRSAVQPLAGMNTASDSRYEVMASFSVSGLVPMSAAIAGSEVEMTVESMFSMNRAVATMSGIRRSLFMEIRGGNKGREEGLYHPVAAQAIAERPAASKSCVTGSVRCGWHSHFGDAGEISHYATFCLNIVSCYAIIRRERDRVHFRRRPPVAQAYRSYA